MVKSILISAVGMIVSLSQAHADWRFCNRTPDRVRVAVAFNPGEENGGLYARGWTIIPPGRCRMVVSSSGGVDEGPPPFSGVFYYAESTNGVKWHGNPSAGENSAFCVNPYGNFETNMRVGRRECEARGYRFYNFRSGRWTTDDYTINLDGPRPPASAREGTPYGDDNHLVPSE